MKQANTAGQTSKLESARELVIGTLRASTDGVLDPIVRQLASHLLTMTERPELATRIFVDHVALALDAQRGQDHIPSISEPQAQQARGGLAPWQERRAKELMGGQPGTDLSLASIAGECGLSVSHFARAFKQCTGKPPHKWLLESRVERARDLLLNTGMSLAEVALECGFSDQSHFTRVFSRVVGTSPGTWQRLRRSRQSGIGEARPTPNEISP
ncbi:AraC family transcriptional regulator [Skermanella stibiiresistens SB22]|uniref:AraC family transcriptional regulator n=1 Tax=Skermanella stibiiresistens SB22 TaxID=1385369 RepID=W9H0F8_9PROT|nr:AraC family transcriptional regulator [Skermanella stibiiresistens]EWY39559.1 AraC family transcriptional regulator [Skermanella stibiiresistens SB22]